MDDLKHRMDECTDKLSGPSFFAPDTLQTNALRVESLRDTYPRCGLKMPAHWHDDVKKRGWGIWIFSGGSACVFGHCRYSDCPKKDLFLQNKEEELP